MCPIIRVGSFGVSAGLAVAVLAACGGGQSSFMAARFQDAALTMPHFVPPAVHPDHRQSRMFPDKGEKSAILFVGDWSTNDVYVYDNFSGKPLRTLIGNDEPYGMCVDAKGDVYVANFGSGVVNEYTHDAKLINTYSTGGELIGCSVSAKGDVAATSFDPGEVTVYPKGKTTGGTTYSDSSCEYLWSMAFDDKGNLVGIGENSSVAFCAVLAGSKTMTTLSTSSFTATGFPGDTEWDGKYFAFENQENDQSGFVQATLRGKTLTYVGETTFSDNCYKDYTAVVSPFIVGKTNTLFNGKQGNVVVGPNLWCVDVGAPKFDYWNYPGGGLPFKILPAPPAEPYGAAVSLASK